MEKDTITPAAKLAQFSPLYRFKLQGTEPGDEISGEGLSFALAAIELLRRACGAYGDEPEPELFEALAHFARGKRDPFERRDFSTPESNFTLRLEITPQFSPLSEAEKWERQLAYWGSTTYAKRVTALELEGLTTSDAQGCADARFIADGYEIKPGEATPDE